MAYMMVQTSFMAQLRFKLNNNIVQLGLDFKLNTKIGLDTHPPTTTNF